MKFLIFVTAIVLIQSCQSLNNLKQPEIHNTPEAALTTALVDATLVDGFSFKWGGFSGLSFINKDEAGDLYFWTLTDRGPNGDKIKKNQKTMRSFLSPKYTPSFVKLKYDKKNKKVIILNTLPFLNHDNTPLTGLPPKNSISNVESPTDLDGVEIETNSNGVDSESIAVDENNHFWVGDEYFPSLLEFDQNGKLLSRITPAKKPNSNLAKNEIPNVYSQRSYNRGFEALGYKDNKLFFMLQSPIKTSDYVKNKGFSIIRIGVFNTKTRLYEGEYLYPLTQKKVNRIGDLTMINETEFYVIEQNNISGRSGVHLIYKVNLAKATNLVRQPLEKNPESFTKEDLLSKVTLVEKTLTVDLVNSGYDTFDKVEGITLINDKTLAVINDNDFGIINNKISEIPTVLGIISLP